MSRHLRECQTLFGALILASTGFLAASVRAQGSPIVLLLDQNAIAANRAPTMFKESEINGTIAGVGVRDPIPYFKQRAGLTIVLPGGPLGHEGWFAIGSMPSSWMSDLGANDAPQNFMLAGPGLGSPDSNGNRSSLLAGVENITPLDASKLQSLIGRQVCAVVYSQEIPWAQTATSLQGATSGTIAFSIAGVTIDEAGLPSVAVSILDEAVTCEGALSLVSF